MNDNLISDINIWNGIYQAMYFAYKDSTEFKRYPVEYLKFRGRATMRYYRVEDHVN